MPRSSQFRTPYLVSYEWDEFRAPQKIAFSVSGRGVLARSKYALNNMESMQKWSMTRAFGAWTKTHSSSGALAEAWWVSGLSQTRVSRSLSCVNAFDPSSALQDRKSVV